MIQPRFERIDALKNSFTTHPATEFLGAKLESLQMIAPNLSLAVVRATAKNDFMVHSNLKTDLIAQGGLSFAIANFAGVYAAMVHTEKHTPLINVSQMKYFSPVNEGDEMIATGIAHREDGLLISVEFSLYANGDKKMEGHAYYRDDKKKT